MSPRITFWLLIAIIAGVGVGKAVQSDTLDWDLFWHLKVAEQLRAEGVGPIVDHLSFSSIKQPWTPYSWLAELGMKSLWDRFGWRSAVAGEAVLAAAIVAVMAMGCVALAGPERRLNCVLGAAAGAFLTIPFVSFRPITFAMLLLAVVAWLLLRDRRERSNSVWAVIAITVLLANVHLCVIVIPIWIACLLAGDWWEGKSVRRYAILLAATCAAALATPMLPGAVRTAWFYQSRDVMVASDFISEMRPVWRGIGGSIKMVAIAALLIFSGKKVQRGEWLWLLVAALMMLRLGKFAPMFALIAGPVLAATLPPMKDHVLRKPIVAGALAIALLVAVVRIATSFPRVDVRMAAWLNRRGAAVGSYPTAAADYVEKNVAPRTGRLINEFNWGGYLAWRLGDRYQVFLDGRTQLYPADFWRATYLGSDQDAARAIAAANADAAIIPVRKPRFAAPLKQLGWRSVYRDEFAEVLLPPPP